MNPCWLTDTHLNFLDVEDRIIFYESVIATRCDAVLISGDIAEAPSISEILKEMATYIKQPIYFVLGNYDYYRGQVDEVQTQMTLITKSEEHLHWLPASGPVNLEKTLCY